jgi:hypothetical protein
MEKLEIEKTKPTFIAATPYPVRPARPWPYLDFEK